MADGALNTMAHEGFRELLFVEECSESSLVDVVPTLHDQNSNYSELQQPGNTERFLEHLELLA